MCVIIVKPTGATMLAGDLEMCYDNNPDGIGFMYAKDGRVIADKFIPESFEEVQEVWDKLEDVDAIIHLRWLTTGERVKGHCHPFRVLRGNASMYDLFFMHNGTIPIDYGEGENDTIAFKTAILKPILTVNPDLLKSKKFISIIEGADYWSRLAFLSGDGTITLTREKNWVTYGGCKLSNNYSTTPGYRDPKPTYTPHSYGRSRDYNPTVLDDIFEEEREEVTNLLPFAREEQLEVVKETTLGEIIDGSRDTEEMDVLASLPECDLVTWLKEDFDDAVETLMTKYDQANLADLMSSMGVAYTAEPLEVDVEYLIRNYPSTVVEFIKDRGVVGWGGTFYAH